MSETPLEVLAARDNQIEESSQLTPEMVRHFNTLHIEIKNDFSPLLDALNKSLGIALQPRPEGYHITIFTPQEKKILATLTQEQIAQLQKIHDDMQRGEGIQVMGIGYIDGSKVHNLRESDLTKKTAFLALDIPALQQWRNSMGLHEKDFHITLGFEVGDIHMQVVGTDQKGRKILEPIPKKADPALDELKHYIRPELQLGDISGQIRSTPIRKEQHEHTNAVEIPIRDGSLVFIIGLPGSGKSTFARKHFPQECIVSTDALRGALSNNQANQLVSEEAFNIATNIVRSRLKNGQTVVIDAMNLSQSSRARFTSIAKEYHCETVGILLDISPEQSRVQNKQRLKQVSDDYLRQKATSYDQDRLLLQNDPSLTQLYRLQAPEINKTHLLLSEEYQKKLTDDLLFDQATQAAEVDIIQYAQDHLDIPGDNESTPRVSVDAGSVNFIIKTPESIAFFERNVLPFQVIDIEKLAVQMGTTVDDPLVVKTALYLLNIRNKLNLTTFVSYPIHAETIIEDMINKIQKRSGNAHTMAEQPSALMSGVLEIRRDADDDTDLLIVGDIHGCYTAIRELSSRVFSENVNDGKFENKRKFLFLGDIADRGPKSAEALLYVTSLVRNREAVWIKGNHDANLEKGLRWLIEQANTSGKSWEDYLREDFEPNRLHSEGIVLSEDTRKTITELLQFTDTADGRVPRLKKTSIEKILAILSSSPTYKEYNHLVAVHASLPKIPRKSDLPLSPDEMKQHTHGVRNGQRAHGLNEIRKIQTVAAKDPDRILVSGHTHEDDVVSDRTAGTINLDADAERQGILYGLYFPELEITAGKEPSVIRLSEQLKGRELPSGNDLVSFIAYLESQGMIEVKQGGVNTPYEGLSVISYSQSTELGNLWELYPSLRHFRGLIVDKEGEIVARPFKKTHKAGVEIPLEQLAIVPDKVFEKANGSMGICYYHNGNWKIATKFSFENDGYTKPATELLHSLNYTDALNPSLTYLFEIILPEDSHIVNYKGARKLVLLNAIDKETGEELVWDQVADTAYKLGCETATDMSDRFEGMTIQQIYAYAQIEGNLQNLEGLMAQYTDPTTNERITVKVKTIEYDQKKFIRDRLKWEKILDRFDWTTLDIPGEHREALMAYNSDNVFVRAALQTRIDWIKREYMNIIVGVQNLVSDAWIPAQEEYDTLLVQGVSQQQAINAAMRIVVERLPGLLQSNNIQIPESTQGQILGFLRDIIADNPQAYTRLEELAKRAIQLLIDKEVQKKGKSSYWLIPEE